MSVAIGIGLMDYPFAGAGDYWRWVDMCEAGGIDSVWQTDPLVSPRLFTVRAFRMASVRRR